MNDLFESKGIHPMLISEQVEPYNDTESIFELKLDGIRCIAYCDCVSTDLRNKRNLKLLPRFPELNTIHTACRDKCILDGELNVLVHGKPDFFEVQRRSLLSDPFKIQLASSRYPVNFVAFDILYHRDHIVTDLPLMERKQLLSDVVTDTDRISISRYIDTDGIALFNYVKEQQLEGIVGKKKDSLYWFGKRTKDWKKIKWLKDEDFICLGYISKPNHMTSLILAKMNPSGQYVLTGHVTLGVSLRNLTAHGIKITSCPLLSVPARYEQAIWIVPIVCTVQYMPSEKDGMRQPVFKGIREDKQPEECRILIF